MQAQPSIPAGDDEEQSPVEYGFEIPVMSPQVLHLNDFRDDLCFRHCRS